MSSIKNISIRILKVVSIIILSATPFIGSTEASLSKGSSFTSFFWTQKTNDSLKNGCYGYAKIDSVVNGTTNRYLSTFWLSKYEWWQKLFTNTYIKTTITTSKGRPSTITNAPAHFSSIEWFTGFERNGSKDTLRFYFPMLPQSVVYGNYDYFTVNVNDTINLEFYGAGDSTMIGTFVHKKPDTTTGAPKLLARNAFIVQLTNANPFRIKSIRCNAVYKSLITAYLKYDLETLKKDVAWYGIDIIDTVSETPKIVVHSVNVEGNLPLKADSTYKISWKLNTATEVDSCVIYASLDNKLSWSRIGKTGADSSFMWKVPKKESDSTFIKITAYGKDGSMALALSTTALGIFVDPVTSVNELIGNLNIVPSITPSIGSNGCAINYALPGKIKEITVSLFDLKGRRIEQIFKRTGFITNRGLLQFKNSLHTGYYFIKVHALREDNHNPIDLSERLMFVR